MAVTYINTKKLRSYVSGARRSKLNRRKAEMRLQELETKEKELLKFQNRQKEYADFLQEGLNTFREYNLNAHREAARAVSELQEERIRYQDLLEGAEGQRRVHGFI